ncbi:VOC family protein [Actinoplanes sp. TBRC 11911]|uniref:VOC family protein n=1 Tax=Actinoplanes sp. TBRC 11911 TaxID=2729386 RepID=UPI00145F00DD|nr:VOC family protein [Actinoplanes sp. TBRC 11911]NMO54713.1 VOC family protein [Actinoplanes sp. TBRC 11911]
MASQLNPYITFNGNAREAMEFYHSILGGDLTVNTFGEFGNPDPAVADKVMHSMVTSPRGYMLMASDTAPGMPFTAGNNMSISLSGDPGEGLEDVWDKLAAGGTVHVPFEKQMWGDVFGLLTDRYGIQWMVDVVAQQ